MSKIIFLCTPAHGHVNPTLPIVRELRRRGEEVIYYDDMEFKRPIEEAGGTFRPYPLSQLTSTAIADAAKDGNLANIIVLHLQATEALLPFTLSELEGEKPDLVVFDSLALWGKMATTILKLPGAAAITHFIFDVTSTNVSFFRTLELAGRFLPNVLPFLTARRRLIKLYGKAAVPPNDPIFPLRGGLNIVFTARDLQPDLPMIDDTFRFVGPSFMERATDGSESLDLSGETVVYISLGTIHFTNVDFFRSCLAAFATYPAKFLLAVGKATDIAKLGAIPPNITVRHFVPQLEVLQNTTVFITHGGMNSIHEALYFGVPMIVIPHQFEQMVNARCVEARGAALVIDNAFRRAVVTPNELRDALTKVMTEPSFGEAAATLKQQLRQTGGYRQAADEIQSFIAIGDNSI